MESNYSTVGGIVYNKPQSPQEMMQSQHQIPQHQIPQYSMAHEPFLLGASAGTTFGYTPQYNIPGSTSSYVPQTYTYSYPEMIPLTFGRLGSAPTSTFPVATIPGTVYGNYSLTSGTITRPVITSTQVATNRAA
jgi:hypothetical protein